MPFGIFFKQPTKIKKNQKKSKKIKNIKKNDLVNNKK